MSYTSIIEKFFKKKIWKVFFFKKNVRIYINIIFLKIKLLMQMALKKYEFNKRGLSEIFSPCTKKLTTKTIMNQLRN